MVAKYSTSISTEVPKTCSEFNTHHFPVTANDSRQLSLFTGSDANYTIMASLLLQLAWFVHNESRENKKSWVISVKRIHFQKHPDQSGEYHHPSHEGCGPQLFLYPRTRHLSGDLEETITSLNVVDNKITQISECINSITILKQFKTQDGNS